MNMIASRDTFGGNEPNECVTRHNGVLLAPPGGFNGYAPRQRGAPT